ncbi:1473_t:CDS:1, partial [Gigaspora margarita]
EEVKRTNSNKKERNLEIIKESEVNKIIADLTNILWEKKKIEVEIKIERKTENNLQKYLIICQIVQEMCQ